MRDPDRCEPRRATAFTPTLQYFLTEMNRFLRITHRRAARRHDSATPTNTKQIDQARSGEVRGRDELENPLHDELGRNRRQQ